MPTASMAQLQGWEGIAYPWAWLLWAHGHLLLVCDPPLHYTCSSMLLCTALRACPLEWPLALPSSTKKRITTPQLLHAYVGQENCSWHSQSIIDSALPWDTDRTKEDTTARSECTQRHKMLSFTSRCGRRVGRYKGKKYNGKESKHLW